MNGPRWIKQWIGELAILNEQFRDEDGSVNFEALGREEYAFRVALITGHTKKSERARLALELAEKAYRASVENGKKGGRPAKNTADAPTREAGENIPDGSDAADMESQPSANHYGVTPHREAGDVSATDSNNSEAPQNRRTDGHSLRVGNVARPPVRSSGRNSRCPNSREDFHAFVADNNLHEGLAEEWYAMHEARGWVDETGNPIKNWRGALYNYCTKTEQKRRTA